jgi:hypothetical protein
MASRKDHYKKSPIRMRLKIGGLSADEKNLALDAWFVEYKNTDTRNSIAQGLKLVDHAGDEIYYDGKHLSGFIVSFDNVLFLVSSHYSGVYKFIAYHKKIGEKNWRRWGEGKKSAKEAIAGFKRKNAFLSQ